MIKTVGFVLIWLTGSAAAVAVAWTGVAIVDNELVVPAPANELGAEVPLDPADIDGSERGAEARVSGPESPTLSPSNDDEGEGRGAAGLGNINSSPSTDKGIADGADGDTAETAATGPTTGRSVDTPLTPESTVDVTTTRPAATGSPSSEPLPSTSTTQPPTTQAPTTTTTTSQPPTTLPGQTLTFNLTGGSTAISFSPTEVKVLWATPNPGFEVKIEPESPGIKVEFRSDEHRSRIDAWWSGGPQHDIREDS